MGQRITTMTSGQTGFPVAPSMFKFAQHGQCGRWVSELLPHTAKIVDDIALMKSVHTNAINHDPACTFVMTGSEVPGKPARLLAGYGLGSESNDLPAFVVLTPRFRKARNGQALFHPDVGQRLSAVQIHGVALRQLGDPVLYLETRPAWPQRPARDARRLTSSTNAASKRIGDPEIHTRIAQYEMAFRMQASVPELIDLSKETQATLDMYGPEVKTPGSFAASALLARRLVERGVRFVQIMHRGWDQHGNLPRRSAQPVLRHRPAAPPRCVQDLKQRGLLDDTLVVWGGEFGRTVYSQGTLTHDNYGRDHHPRNFSMWMAGGGIKGGIVHGETDDFSATTSVEGPGPHQRPERHHAALPRHRPRTLFLQVPRPRPAPDRRRTRSVVKKLLA